eukprot:COSAG06_NODE_394_length_16313_cov_11.756568_7_plen_63_part_00
MHDESLRDQEKFCLSVCANGCATRPRGEATASSRRVQAGLPRQEAEHSGAQQSAREGGDCDG